MKSYTDLDQSRKLAKILPIKSADMSYVYDRHLDKLYGDIPYVIGYKVLNEDVDIPCWSLAALLDVLPIDWWGYNKHYFLETSKMGDVSTPYIVSYFRFREQSDGADFGRIIHISFQSDNPVDACYEMILKLHEQKIL